MILRLLLGEERPLATWGNWDRAFFSEIGLLEGARAIDRLRLTGAYTDEEVAAARTALDGMLSDLDVVELGRPIHQQQGLAARGLGFNVSGT